MQQHDSINGDLIRHMSLRVHGAGGPSEVVGDVTAPHSSLPLIFVSPRGSSSELTYVDPDSLSAFVACRLIALNKDPGVRPIGIGETCRRIISKAILSILGQDVIEAAGPIQLCTRLDGGCEAAVHSLRQLFADANTKAVLLVDATNAFNSLNRAVALRNILEVCPSLGRVLVNTYRENVDLYIDGETTVSQEGTTQGDPLAMAMYSLGVIPLIMRMSEIPSTRQVWYADDSSVCGSIDSLLSWWHRLIEVGPSFGYFPNPPKTWLRTTSNKEQRNFFVIPVSPSPLRVDLF